MFAKVSTEQLDPSEDKDENLLETRVLRAAERVERLLALDGGDEAEEERRGPLLARRALDPFAHRSTRRRTAGVSTSEQVSRGWPQREKSGIFAHASAPKRGGSAVRKGAALGGLMAAFPRQARSSSR